MTRFDTAAGRNWLSVPELPGSIWEIWTFFSCSSVRDIFDGQQPCVSSVFLPWFGRRKRWRIHICDLRWLHVLNISGYAISTPAFEVKLLGPHRPRKDNCHHDFYIDRLSRAMRYFCCEIVKLDSVSNRRPVDILLISGLSGWETINKFQRYVPYFDPIPGLGSWKKNLLIAILIHARLDPKISESTIWDLSLISILKILML
jgi:hypothetical protein